MHLLLASLLSSPIHAAEPMAPHDTPTMRRAIAELLPQAVPLRPTATRVRDGDKLALYRHGDLALLRDDDGEWFNEVLQQGADLEWVLGSVQDAFYRAHEDEYDYLTILLVRDFGLFFAFYSPLANDVSGIGYDSMTPFETFDTSENQLQGMIFMNAASMWLEAPEAGRYVFGQEFMHRWGAFVDIDHPDLATAELLGRDSAHWSFWIDTPNSPMEGNRWTDNGDGTWTTDRAGGSTYSDLDLYLMGLVPAEEVGPQRLLRVTEADAGGILPADAPRYLSGEEDVTVVGTAIPFTVDDIIAAEGPRVPDSTRSPRSFRMAFAVIALAGDPLDDATLDAIDELRARFEREWEEDVGHRADLDTTLGVSTAQEWANGGPVEPADVDTGSGEPDAAEGCGCATGTAPAAWASAMIAALSVLRRRARKS
jgi:MYXO-CTERM domain-containing protein